MPDLRKGESIIMTGRDLVCRTRRLFGTSLRLAAVVVLGLLVVSVIVTVSDVLVVRSGGCSTLSQRGE